MFSFTRTTAFRVFLLSSCLSLFFPGTAVAQEPEATAESRISEFRWVREGISPPASPYRLIERADEIDGGRESRRRVLQMPSSEGRLMDAVIREEETIRVSPSRTRRVQKLYNRTAEERRLVEVQEEEEVEDPQGTRTATRITSSPDLNGNSRVTRREVEKTVLLAPRAWRTDSTVFRPGINVPFEAVERVSTTERRGEEGELEFRQERFVRYQDGAWSLAERVIRTADQRIEEEEVYRRDGTGRLLLFERSTSRHFPGDDDHRITEIYSRNIAGTTRHADGGIHLDRRIRSVRTLLPGDVTRTVTETEQRRIVDPSGELELVHRATTFEHPDGTSRQEIETGDGNRRLTTTSTAETR